MTGTGWRAVFYALLCIWLPAILVAALWPLSGRPVIQPALAPALAPPAIAPAALVPAVPAAVPAQDPPVGLQPPSPQAAPERQATKPRTYKRRGKTRQSAGTRQRARGLAVTVRRGAARTQGAAGPAGLADWMVAALYRGDAP